MMYINIAYYGKYYEEIITGRKNSVENKYLIFMIDKEREFISNILEPKNTLIPVNSLLFGYECDGTFDVASRVRRENETVGCILVEGAEFYVYPTEAIIGLGRGRGEDIHQKDTAGYAYVSDGARVVIMDYIHPELKTKIFVFENGLWKVHNRG